MSNIFSIFLRLIGFLAVGFVAWTSFVHATANIMARQNPDGALSMVADHSEALANKANLLFAANFEDPPARKIEKLAKKSLKGDLVNAKAVRLLATSNFAENKMENFRALIGLSERLSRREFMTQIYLVQEAARQNKVPQSLSHFDIALKTNRGGADLVYAILTPLLSDANIRSGLKPYIEREATWVQPFFAYAVNNGEDAESIADTLIEAGGLKYDPDYPYTQGNIINRLILGNKFQAARAFYLEGVAGDPSALTSIGFNSANTESRFAPISWRLASSPVVVASFEGQSDLKMRVEAGPEATATAAHKTIYLKPGTYQASFDVIWGPFDTEGEIKFSIACVVGHGGTVFADSANASKAKDGIAGRFVIPFGCPAQIAIVQIESFPGQGGVDVLLSSPRLKRL